MKPVFNKNEYQRRVDAVRASMAEKGMDVLIEADPANMYYLTGYDGWSFYVPQMVVVPPSGEPVWIGRGVDFGGAKLTCWMAPSNIVAYPEITVQHPVMHPMDFVGEELIRRGLGNKRIGFPVDCYYFTPRASAALRKAMPNATVVDTDLLVNWVRLTKSDAEVALMKQAARVTEKIVDTYYAAMQPGRRQCDAAGDVLRASAQGTARFGGDYASCMPFMPIGEQTQASHLTWTDQIIKPGQTSYIECSGVRFRYHSPLARSIWLGPKPPQNLLDVNKVVLEGMEAALAEAKPGNTCGMMADSWQKVLDRYGVKKESRIGYATGIGYPPDWGEHTASLRAKDPTVLKPNMCFHMILGMWMDGWGFESSETFRITETGHECLAKVPRGLKVIEGARGKSQSAGRAKARAKAKKAAKKKTAKGKTKRRR
jgi:Xaa-Pro aminopeptidase